MFKFKQVNKLTNVVFVFMLGVPLLIVLCNHVAQAAVGGKLHSWWLAHDTMIFYSCICCGLLLLILFTFLYINVSTHLMVLISNKNTDANKAILRRQVFIYSVIFICYKLLVSCQVVVFLIVIAKLILHNSFVIHLNECNSFVVYIKIIFNLVLISSLQELLLLLRSKSFKKIN